MLVYALALLDTEVKLLEKAKMNKDLQDGLKDSLKDSVGLNNEFVKTLMKGGIAALGLLVLAKVVQFFVGAVKRGIELNKTLGLNAKNAAVFEGNLQRARLSSDGIKHDMDDIRKSADELVKQTGNINFSPDLLINATEIAQLLGDDSLGVSLTRTIENAGVDSGKLADNVKDMANAMGVDATSAMEMLASNQGLLNGMTEEQMMNRAEEGLLIKKMGLDVKKMNDLASEAVDIESSLRNEMKLRMLTGQDISFQALNQAKMEGDSLAVAEEARKMIEKLGPAYENNAQMQRMVADATGFTKDEIQNVLNAGKEQKKLDEELLELRKEMPEATMADLDAQKQQEAQTASTISTVGQWALGLGAVAAAYLLIKKYGSGLGKMMGGKGGNPIANFIKGFGNAKVLMGAAAMILVAASLFVFGKAVQQFMDVKLEDVGLAVLAMFALVGALAALGLIMSSPIGAGVLIGAAAMLIIAAAMLVLGIALQEIAKGFGMMGELTESLTGLITISPMLIPLVYILGSLGAVMAIFGIGLLVATPGILAFGMAVMVMAAAVPAISMMATGLGALVQIAPGLIALAGAFGLLGLSMLPLALGLALLTPFLGTVLVLGLMLPLIASAMGIGGDSSDTSSSSANGGSSDPLLEEIQGLRRDIQSQPIQIVIDDKVISTMNKKNTRMQGYRDQLK
jgi:hypothetical protein